MILFFFHLKLSETFLLCNENLLVSRAARAEGASTGPRSPREETTPRGMPRAAPTLVRHHS